MKNTAVIGYGGQGAWHTEQIKKSDVVSLAGVYDIVPEKRELAQSRGIHTYSSVEELLADKKVDIVVIATPNDSHKELCIRALEAGKNVICEKPVMLSSNDLEDVLDVARETGMHFTAHQNRRYDVDFLAIKGIINSGEIGPAIAIESRIHGSRGIPSDWRGKKEYGGGMLYDWGIHLIDQVMQLFPEDNISKVFCTEQHTTNNEVDDGFKLELLFNSGITAHIEVGTLNFIAMPRFYLQCQNGSALITNWQQKTKVVHCKYWNEKEVLPIQTAAGITKTMAPRDEITTEAYEIDIPKSDVHDFYRNFVKSIDGLEPQYVTHEESLQALRIIETAFKSIQEKQVVDFDNALELNSQIRIRIKK